VKGEKRTLSDGERKVSAEKLEGWKGREAKGERQRIGGELRGERPGVRQVKGER